MQLLLLSSQIMFVHKPSWQDKKIHPAEISEIHFCKTTD